MSTGIGYGIATPHVKLPGISEFFVTVGIHKRGVNWDALDGQPVHLLFLIAGPDQSQERYLRILARLVQVIKEPSRRTRFRSCNTRFDVFELLKGF
jgi:PTS system nitrogen regulatory IIA component